MYTHKCEEGKKNLLVVPVISIQRHPTDRARRHHGMPAGRYQCRPTAPSSTPPPTIATIDPGSLRTACSGMSPQKIY
ncbi:unnamed protein product [Cercopithifilaria johnstoni]|uniref:Uncharacterized protein n=1 Tax=Cercopithifilaria johnstoni TaxID=2874296 RepID=A0A8J2PTN1_9BILA|nr:unnamed protein product [Cercopithifilaria johnstoni]